MPKDLKNRVLHKFNWQRMEFRPNLDSLFLQDIFYKLKSTLTLQVTNRNMCGTCKAQLFLPLYDLQDNKVLTCRKYMVLPYHILQR